VMAAVGWRAWEGVRLEINGCEIPVVHERLASQRDTVGLILRARITPAIVAAGAGVTRLTLTVPETKQILAHVRRLESFDTYNNDMRMLGVAVHRVRIRPAAPQVAPVLSLRRPQAARDAEALMARPEQYRRAAPMSVAQG
jgi:hypothetical protein